MDYEGKNLEIYLENKKIDYCNIIFFEIVENINKHGKLRMRLQIDNKNKNYFMDVIERENTELRIEILFDNKNRREIFLGIIEYFQILNYGNGGFEINLDVYSKSILLDRKKEKKYRVFQDLSYSYENILDEINKEYINKKVKVIGNVKEKIKNIIIQYEETDWEFLVRLSSHIKTAMFINERGVISFGEILNKGDSIEKIDCYEYSQIRECENRYFKIKSNNIIKIGQRIDLQSERDDLLVLKSKIYLENNIIKSEFIATDFEKYHIDRKYNEKIIGNRIEVRVERVLNDENIAKMEVSFYDGLRKIVENNEDFNNNYKTYKDYGINRVPLSYQTFYSQSNTGLFCTPEIGDIVEIYFTNRDEKSGKISWAINNKGNGRFSNYENRNFHINGNDFNLKINRDSMELDIKKSYTRNSESSLETGENFINRGSKNLLLISDEYVGMESVGECSVYGDSLEIVGKGRGIRIESPSDIRIKGKRVHNN